MCCNNKESQNHTTSSCCSCLNELLERIILLQQNTSQTCEEGCDRPFLSDTTLTPCLNTRPINLYSCCSNILWTMPYTQNGVTGTSSVFRIENIDDCCAKFRVLVPSTTTPITYTTTNDFFIMNLECIGAIKCLGDVFVAGV